MDAGEIITRCEDFRLGDNAAEGILDERTWVSARVKERRRKEFAA